MWQKAWGGSHENVGFSVSLDTEGNIFLSGQTYGLDDDSADVALLKYSTSGELLWQQAWGGVGEEVGHGVSVINNGVIYLVGWAPDASGSWWKPSSNDTTPSGITEVAEGIVNELQWTETSPSGTETIPQGIKDEGGGADDILMMKVDPAQR